MKILITILAFLNGCYMMLDGVFVLINGKYIGPEKPGPWASIFYKLDVDVFKLGPLFILFGLLWLTWLYGLLTNQSWAYWFGLLNGILTLWYLPVGTFFSILIILTLLFDKQKIGM